MQQRGRFFYHAVLVCFFIWIATIIGGIIWWANRSGDRPTAHATPQQSNPQPDVSVSLPEAKVIIPPILTLIYHALNDGDPVRASNHIVDTIYNNTSALDAICRPFNFQAHYIESVVVRRAPHFEVHVRTLYRALEERAYTMTFFVTRQQCVLERVEDADSNWWTPQKEEAEAVVRRFLYAMKAQKYDIARETVSPGFPFSKIINEPELIKHISWVQEVEIYSSGTTQDRGLKLAVTVRFPESLSLTSDERFSLEPFGGQLKIVHAFYTTPEMLPNIFKWPPGVEDPDIEEYTLRRFKIRQSRGTPPVVISKVEPNYSDEARNAHFNGEVKASFVVNEEGRATEITVIDSPGLGLDQKISEALQQWQFKPATKDGVPVPQESTATFTFRQN